MFGKIASLALLMCHKLAELSDSEIATTEQVLAETNTYSKSKSTNRCIEIYRVYRLAPHTPRLAFKKRSWLSAFSDI